MQRPVYEWLCLCPASRMLLTEILITIILNKIQYMVKHFCKILWHVLNRHVTLSVNKIWSVLKADVTLLERFSPVLKAEEGVQVCWARTREELIWKAISRGFEKRLHLAIQHQHPGVLTSCTWSLIYFAVSHSAFCDTVCGCLYHPSMTVALRTSSSERAEP